MDTVHEKLNHLGKPQPSTHYIPKDKYDRLLIKYQNLKIQKQSENEVGLTENSLSPINDLENFRTITANYKEPEDSISKLLLLINSTNRHVQVRAHYELASIYESLNECDQSLTFVEEIINNHAWSGVVLPALALGVRCGEKLKLHNRTLKYVNLLERFL